MDGAKDEGSVYDLFRDLAQVGMQGTLYLRVDGGLREKHGVVRRILGNGVLIQNSNESTFVSADSLVNFTLAPVGDDKAGQSAVAPPVQDDRVTKTQPPSETMGVIADDGADEQIDEVQFEIFSSQIQLHPPRPDSQSLT